MNDRQQHIVSILNRFVRKEKKRNFHEQVGSIRIVFRNPVDENAPPVLLMLPKCPELLLALGEDKRCSLLVHVDMHLRPADTCLPVGMISEELSIVIHF